MSETRGHRSRAGSTHEAMQWVGWILDSIRGGAIPPAPARAADEEFEAATNRAVSSLDTFDRALAVASESMDKGAPTERQLGRTVAELSRATSGDAGRMALALSRARPTDRPGPEDPAPPYFRGWFPLLNGSMERYEVVELAVHVLAAEIRARRARTAPGASRPQDLHVVLLLLREALRGADARNAYVHLARREFPREANSMPVAANAIKSAFMSRPSRRVYRCQEIVLEILEAEAVDPETIDDLHRRRRAEAMRLDLLADERAADYYEAQRQANVARRGRDAIAGLGEEQRGLASGLAVEALRAALSVAAIAARAGTSSRERSIRRRLDHIAGLQPDGLSRSEAAAEARYAAEASKRMASELKNVAREASVAAEAARRSLPDSPNSTLHDPPRLRLGGLREAMQIP